MDLLTRERRRPTRTAISVVLLLLAACALGGCAKKNPRPDASEITSYVALGDSYTAVSGAGPFTDAACLRTDADYPALVAERLHIPDFKNVSCAGATSTALTQVQYPQNGRGSNPPQLDALNDNTKLVTIGLGLNNSGLSAYLLYLCIPVNGKVSAACTAYLNAPGARITNAIRAMGGEVKGNLDAIRTRAPNAQVVLVGYPRMLPDEGVCATQLPLPPVALDRIRTALKTVDEVLERTARRARVDYVDMYKASEGHDVCSNDPWVNGQANLAGKALAFHSYEAYHVAVADKIISLIAKN